MRSRPHLTLARQVLLLQMGVLVVVVALTGVVSFRQSEADFQDRRSSRLRTAAEALAGVAAVQDGLERPGVRTALAFYAQQRADTVGASAVYLADASGVVYAGTDPSRYGEPVDLGPRTVLDGRAWTGDITDGGNRAIAAEVPVFSNGPPDPSAPDARIPRAGTLVGVAVVTEDYPPFADRLRRALGDSLVVLALGLALGVVGSWLLARLVKRRTRGLEPAEIAALADQREALLTSIREGVVAVAGDGTVTVASPSARDLLGLPADAAGRRLDDLGLAGPVLRLLAGGDTDAEVRDAVVVVAGRAVVVNRTRVEHGGRDAGTVTTLRDRTELLALQSELQLRRSITDTLRAQTHEFSNQLHTISGLVQLEEYDEVGRLIGTLTRRRAEISDAVTARVEDPGVAALLVAKASLAGERRVQLVLAEDSSVPRLGTDLSADMTTVVGNLVDNAVDAVSSSGSGRVEIRLRADHGAIRLEVTDSGPGVPDGLADQIFRRGFSTGPPTRPGGGVGLALVQVVCERRGGSVAVTAGPAGGAVFTAVLPGHPDDAVVRPGAPELRVLVVDDDFMVASIHTRFVDRVEGFLVVGQAATAASALAEVERLSPDLLLLDVHLPDRSGIEVLRALRGAGSEVGVVMVTAAREADTVRAAAAAGAAHYLVKPFEFEDLAARLLAFREAHLALLRADRDGDEEFGQQQIDAVFAPLGRGRTALPKGLSPQTAEAVRAAVDEAGDLSAGECAERVGVSRVSARRYLEHFVAEGSLTVGLRYGGAGRPERRYRTA